MSKSKKSLTKTKLALAIAVALGCSLMSVASAATYDMTSSEYAGGINVVDQTFGSRKAYDDFIYSYDAATDTLNGGALNITMATKYDNYIYGNFVVKRSDLPDMKTETLNKVYAQLRKKLNFDSDSTLNNRRQNECFFEIVDNDGTVLRRIGFTPLENNAYRIYNLKGVWKEVLRNDGKADTYPISNQADPSENLPEGNWNISNTEITIAPDYTGEAVKAAVQGSDNNLTLGFKYGSSDGLHIISNGNPNDTVYGIYNDKKGYINITNTTELDITAAGNEKSNAIYAGNNGDYKSSISIKSGSNGATLIAGGDVIAAGKNGEITINPSKITLTSNSNGNILHAYDGGIINVFSSYTIDKFNYSEPTTEKYLAIAENGGTINFGVNVNHLDDVDYDDVSYTKFNKNFVGNLKAADDSKINFGMEYNGNEGGRYTGNVDGNVNLYLKGG